MEAALHGIAARRCPGLTCRAAVCSVQPAAAQLVGIDCHCVQHAVSAKL